MLRLANWFKVFPNGEGGYAGVGHNQKKITDAHSWEKLLNLARYLMLPRDQTQIENFVQKKRLTGEYELLSEMDALIDAKYIESDLLVPDYIERNKVYWNLTYQDKGEAYRKLKNAKIALIGCGGLGTNCALLLCSTGIGELKLIDPDTIENSNLNRQFTYCREDVGESKAKVLKGFLAARFSETVVKCHPDEITSRLDLLNDADIVLCCADEPDTLPNIIQNYCAQKSLAYLNAGYIGNYAVVGPLLSSEDTAIHERTLGSIGADGDMESVSDINNYSKPASYGTLNYLSAAIAVEELTKFIIGRHDLLVTKSARLGMELRSMDFRKIIV